MKKVFLSVLAMAIMSGATVYAGNGKKRTKKVKTEKCAKANCCQPNCDKSTCPPRPGCGAAN